jgi:hypothetical protein
MEGWDEFYELYKKTNRRSMRWDNVYQKTMALYNTNIRLKLKNLPKINILRQDVEGCLDLLGAIYEYRTCPDVEVYMAKNHDLEHQRSYVESLWNEFSKNSPEKMADLMYEMFNDIDALFGGDK